MITAEKLYADYLARYNPEFDDDFEAYKKDYDPEAAIELAELNDKLTHEDLLKLVENSKKYVAIERLSFEDRFPTILNSEDKVNCCFCEKELDFSDHELVMEAGFVELSFHYGSRHDQCKGFGRWPMEEKPDQKEVLLACDKIEGYICDDCFVNKAKFFKGFVVEQTRVEKRKI